MKKLITESNFDISTVINESENGEKTLFIEGIFASAEKKNRNGRVYPKSILEREVNKITTKMNENRLLGELNHPINRTEVDLKESAIRITELNWNKNDVYGKARVLNTPNGSILKALLEAECKIGISSRGIGTVSEGLVNEDFDLLTWDVVDAPSNQNSFVNGILEGVEFETEEDKLTLKEELEQLKKENKSLNILVENLKKEVTKNRIDQDIQKVLSLFK